MRVGLIAPPWVPVPPPGYGGTEVVVDNLARGLTALGHEVVLFSVAESACPVSLRYLFEQAAVPMGISVNEAAHDVAAYDALADVDVIHDHTLLGPLIAAATDHEQVPIVITQHGPFDAENRLVFAESARHAAVVAISRSQARQAFGVPLTAIVHHGIDLETFRPADVAGGHLLFLGRMSPDKGADRAIRVARACGRRLVIVTKMREQTEREFFDTAVRPLLGPDVEVLVEPPFAHKIALLQGADALLNPISWPEPFGLVMTEALACGTPVLGFGQGAAPEIVDHGVTGLLVDDESALADAIDRLGTIERRACRAAMEARFSLQRMSRDYVQIYRRAIAARAETPHRRAGRGGLATEGYPFLRAGRPA